MKTLLAAVLAISTTATSLAAQKKETAASFKIDPAATTIAWTGKKITGKHDGTIAVKEGSLDISGEIITAGNVVVDMNTIKVTDIPETDEYNAKLVGHLKNEDFFNVTKFPEATLKIKSSEKTAKGLKVKGDLTMLGQTNPVEFETTLKNVGDTVTSTSTIVLDRTKWNLKYGSANFFKNLGDKAIHNEFTLVINMTAKK